MTADRRRWRLVWAPLAAVLVWIGWPRVKCWTCGRRVWGWALMAHLQAHIAERVDQDRAVLEP